MDDKVVSIDRSPRYSRAPQQQEDPENRQRIKIWMGVCLVITAAFIDLIQGLLTLVAIGVVLSPIISVAADFLFWLWFQMLGVSFIKSPKRFAVFGIQSILELIPIWDAIPILTAGILATVIMTRSEDSGGIILKAANVMSKDAIGGTKEIFKKAA